MLEFIEFMPKISLLVQAMCCALYPFGLTCQWWGMVWDSENVVGLNKLLFLPINVCSIQFCNHLFLGTLGVSHFGPVLGRAAQYGGGATPWVEYQHEERAHRWDRIKLQMVLKVDMSSNQSPMNRKIGRCGGTQQNSHRRDVA